MHTLNEGQSLLDSIREIGSHSEMAQNRHATTAACYGIEKMLEQLHDRRRRLEELWHRKKIQLEQCLQLRQIEHDIRQVQRYILFSFITTFLL